MTHKTQELPEFMTKQGAVTAIAAPAHFETVGGAN